MRYGIAIRHPEHVHFFRNPVQRLRERGHEGHLFVREFGHTTELLDAYDLSYDQLAREATSTVSLLTGHARFEYRLLAAARRLDLDVLASIGGRAVSHVAPLAGAKSAVFMDWQRGTVDGLVAQLSNTVCVPRFVDGSFGPNEIRYDGLHELSYLCPANFAADAARLRERDVALDGGRPRFVVGFSHLDASSRAAIDAVVANLSDRGDVYLSHESADLPAATPGRRLAPSLAHQLLAHADLYVGDSGTMATEAAVLGTPAIRLRPHSTPEPRCRFLQETYDLLYSTADPDDLVDRVATFDPADGDAYRARRDRLLDETTDVAGLVADVIEREGER